MTWGVVYGLQAGMVGVGLLALYCALTTPTLLCLTTLVALYYLYTRERRKAAGTLPLNDKTVLITGCDTGKRRSFWRRPKPYRRTFSRQIALK